MDLDKGQKEALRISDRRSGAQYAETDYGRAGAAGYIEEMLREMELIAAKHGIEPLRDLLRMAKEEARKAAGVGLALETRPCGPVASIIAQPVWA